MYVVSVSTYTYGSLFVYGVPYSCAPLVWILCAFVTIHVKLSPFEYFSCSSDCSTIAVCGCRCVFPFMLYIHIPGPLYMDIGVY